MYAVYLKVLDPPLPSPASLQSEFWRLMDITVSISEKSTRLMANMSGDEVVLNCTVTSTDKTDDDIDVVWTRDGTTINFNNTESGFFD